jgi:rhomboid protease GluP
MIRTGGSHCPDTIPDKGLCLPAMPEEEQPKGEPQGPPDPSPPGDPAEPSIGERIRSSPVTFALAAVNVAAFLWAETHGSTLKTATLLQYGAVERLHVASGEWWRLGTSMFMHVGWMHLLWNTYASFGWCTVVEKVLGKRRFLAVYLLSGIGGACASALFHRITAAGASGAMFGIIGATLVLRYRVLGDIREFVRDRFVRSNVMNMAIWTAIGIYAINMDNFAHGGGLVVGAITTLAATMAPARRKIGWGAAVALVALCVVAAARPGWQPKGEDGEATAAYALVYSEGIEGFSKNAARSERMRALACRDPASTACMMTKPAPEIPVAP